MPRINFVELPTVDIEKARQFYAQVFGWDIVSFGPSYSCTMTGDVDLGFQGDAGEATKSPLAVILVDDLAIAHNEVSAAGGHISKEVFSFPGGRRFHFLDPNGNELAVMQAD